MIILVDSLEKSNLENKSMEQVGDLVWSNGGV